MISSITKAGEWLPKSEKIEWIRYRTNDLLIVDHPNLGKHLESAIRFGIQSKRRIELL